MIWVMDCWVGVRDSQGQIVRTVGMLQDITPRKEQEVRLLTAQARLRNALTDANASRQTLLSVLEDQKRVEAALRESETEFQVLFESNPLAIGLYDADGNLLRVNAAKTAMLGYSTDELRQVNPTHPEDIPASVELFRRLAAGEINHYEREERYICQDGQTIWVHITATRVCDADGDLRYVMLVSSDTTEHKLAEERLLESETMLRLIYDNASDGINLYEELPDGTRRLVDCNERYAEMAGRTKAELLAAGSTQEMQIDLQPPHGPEGAQEQWSHRGTISWIRPDRKENVIEYTAVHVKLGGRTMTVGIDRDITDRIRAEEALKEYADRLEELVAERTQALEAAQDQLLNQTRLATLGHLASSIAHELRTPLGVIKNATYLIGHLHQSADDQVGEALDILNEEVRRSDRIITTLLNFARPHTPYQQVVDAAGAVASALERLVLPPTVQVDVSAEDGLPYALVDAIHLDQVLNNLLSNALQAMPGGGRLTVQIGYCAALPEIAPPGFGPPPEAADAAAGWLVVRVADTGSGIAPEHLRHLFEPLYTTKARGFGLGLALVKMLVQANGGGMVVTSASGEGATFELYLSAVEPLAEGAATRKVAIAMDSEQRYQHRDDPPAFSDTQRAEEAAHDDD